MDKKEIKKIKEDLSFIRKKVLALLLYGSYSKGEENLRSDIDICVVAPYIRNGFELLKEIMEKVPSKYDIRIFELMPLYMKWEVIQNHIILYSEDIYKLYEYFYFYSKFFEEQKYRQKLIKEEILKFF